MTNQTIQTISNSPNPDGAMLVWEVRDSPVVIDGETSYGVAKVIVSAPLCLHALWCSHTSAWSELLPDTSCSILSTIVMHYSLGGHYNHQQVVN